MFFKKKIKGTGALLDNRTTTAKAKDYHFNELVSSATPVMWVEKSKNEWRKFPIFNQDGSGSCVAQTLAKLLGVSYWLSNNIYIHFSATHIYQQRANKPNSGMIGVDAFDVAKNGVTLEELVPSQNMTDAQMDLVDIPQYKKDVGKIFQITNYILPPIQDIETIASIIQETGKAVMVWFYFISNEWTNEPTVIDTTLSVMNEKVSRHSVAAVDFTLYKGKKALIIEDSWGTSYGVAGQRIITEEFFNKRNWFTGYVMTFKFQTESIDKPIYTFTQNLEFGMTSNSIIQLQNILKYEGLFPANIKSTGYYGAITRTAVEKFQDKYNVAHSGDAGYGFVGPKTRAQLNNLYS